MKQKPVEDLRIGDRVESDGRSGVVRAVWGDFAAVECQGRLRLHVPLKNLRSLDAEARAAEEGAAKAAADVREQVRQAALTRLRTLIERDFLGAEARFAEEFEGLLAPEDLDTEKEQFVKAWVSAQGNLRSPDSEQARAIACVNGNIQVIARAGSGKTTTLVNRTVFLLKRCGIAPGEMLLLAFNRKAAREIRLNLLIALIPETAKELDLVKARTGPSARNRSGSRTDLEAAAIDAAFDRFKGRLPHVMTFHALAHAIVHPEGRLLYDGSDGDALGLSRAVQEVVDEFLRDPKSHDRVRSLMMDHFREDWDRIVDGGFHLGKEDQLALRRSLPRETLSGELVKSFGEKAIADWLFEHGVAYRYERNHWWDGVNYKPDFTIFDTEHSGLVIEYFGLAGDGNYDEQIVRKRSYWKAKARWTLVEIYPEDVVGGIGADVSTRLMSLLRECEIPCARLSEEDIWQRIRVRAIDRFTRAAGAFIGRCRKKAWDPLETVRRISSHPSVNPVERKFLSLGADLFGAYVERLAQTGDEDFDGLMQKAADRVRFGVELFANRSGVGNVKTLKYVCVDEFQDFSESFYRLIDSLRLRNPLISFFCVGDDWQAINGFAGAELRFFEKFEQYFGAFKSRHLPTNYRSGKAIVTVGNALMHGKGLPGRADTGRLGRVWKVDLEKFKPSLIEMQRHAGDVITPLTARLVHKFLNEGKQVVLLARRNGLPWYVKASAGQLPSKSLDGFLGNIRSMMPEEYRDFVTISTAHKYKGLEKQAVIVLDAVARSYPLVHPDWPFYRIFGDEPGKITEDERRLFYVALTRASEDLVIIADGANSTPFLEEIATHARIGALPLDAFPPVASTTDPKLLLKVVAALGRAEGGTFGIKDLLGASRFQYNGTGRMWERAFRAETFSLSAVQMEPWARAATGVDAAFHDERGILIASYAIDRGNWRCIADAWHLLGQHQR